MRFWFIDGHRDQFSVRRMCEVLEVSPSGYYAWRSRSESDRSREDRRLRVLIRVIHKESRASYGSRRVYRELLERGESCCRHRVARLMREEGLRAKKRRKFSTTTDSRHSHPVAANLLNQDFHVETPDSRWAGDITYLRTREGWLYLSVLLDLCSRFVVGWSIRENLGAELTLEALERAVELRDPQPGVMHHSDRGAQYTCVEYRERLESLGMTVSMSRKGNCFDNAVVESFFDSLKTELGDEAFDTRDQARAAVFDYIEVFYNRQRRHSSLDYQSPAHFERELAA